MLQICYSGNAEKWQLCIFLAFSSMISQMLTKFFRQQLYIKFVNPFITGDRRLFFSWLYITYKLLLIFIVPCWKKLTKCLYCCKLATPSMDLSPFLRKNLKKNWFDIIELEGKLTHNPAKRLKCTFLENWHTALSS